MAYIILGIIIVLLTVISIIYFQKTKNTSTKSEKISTILDKSNTVNIVKQQQEIIYTDHKLEYEIDGEKIFKIEAFKKNEVLRFDTKFDQVEKSTFIKNSFNAVFAQIPMLGINIINFKSLIISFPPSVLKGLNDGTFKLMQGKNGLLKSIAVDVSNGQSVAIGNIASVINPVAAIATVWQVAAMLTAQKFLVEINKKLEKIEGSINELKEFVEIQEISIVRGNLDYLKKISNTIQSEMLSENEISTFHSQMEYIERDCLKASNTIKTILDRHISSIKNYNFHSSKSGDWFGSNIKSASSDLSQKMEHCSQYFNFMFIIQYVRLCNAKTLSCLPVNEMIYKSTLSAIDTDFEEVVDERKRFNTFLEKNIPEFDTKWSKASTDLKFQQQLSSKLSDIDKALQLKENSIFDLKLDINEQLKYKKKTTTTDDRFYIELDENNNIKTMRRLEKYA